MRFLENACVMTTRAFFLAAGAAAVTLAATACEAGTVTTAVADKATIEALLHKAARHKQVIAAPKINNGAALRYAGNTLNAFETAFNEGAGSVRVVAVLYGTSLLFAANDSLWNKYQLFDALDRSGDSLPAFVHSPQNPFYKADPSATEDFTVETLTKRGVLWFVCNNALMSLTRNIAQVHGADPETVYQDFRTNFVSGTTIVPSGVATLVLANEAGFALLPA
jgi:intracellular sulfur oxidation DsrE/DsrF family protein